MDLGLSEAQQMLKNSAQEFLEAECPDTYVREMEDDERGYTAEMWQKLAEQGWLGLIIPEKYGGVELEFQDLIILLEEMGRHMLPGPYFSTVVMGGMSIMEAGTEDQKQEYLPRIAEGQIIVTLALNEPSGRWDARSSPKPMAGAAVWMAAAGSESTARFARMNCVWASYPV